MNNWLIILIHLLAWLIPGIYLWKWHRNLALGCLLIFGGFALGSSVATGSPIYLLFWAMYASISLIFTLQLKGWWFWSGLALIPLSGWVLVQYVLTKTILWF